MEWLENYIYSWVAPSEEQQIDQAIRDHTAFVEKDGQWSCFIRRDITRHYIKRYIIMFFREKGFQAICTGPRSITFQQDDSMRRCSCTFARVFQQKKRVRIHYLEGETLDPQSPTAVFFQAVLMELAHEMAKAHMLHEMRPDPLPDLPTTLAAIADENTMLKPTDHYWVAFLADKTSAESKKLFRKYAGTHQFAVEEGPHGALVATNQNLKMRVTAQTGYNNNDELLLHCQFAVFRKRETDEAAAGGRAATSSAGAGAADEDELEEEEDRSTTIVGVQTSEGGGAAHTGDPDLRRGDQEYFHSFFLGLGRMLAQYELLRTQKFGQPSKQEHVTSIAGSAVPQRGPSAPSGEAAPPS